MRIFKHGHKSWLLVFAGMVAFTWSLLTAVSFAETPSLNIAQEGVATLY